MILRKATTAYILILTSFTLIPVSVYLTTPMAHAMITFASYQDLQEFVHGGGCRSPAPSLDNRGGPTTGLATAGPASQSNGASSQSPTHSETNQQVSGVDELDTVKNDGQYIYTITNNTVAIVQAYPATDATLVSKVTVNGTLQGIFLVGNKLVIVSEIPGFPYPYYGGGAKVPALGIGAPQPSNIATIYPIQFSGTTTTIYVSLHDVYLTQPVWSQSQQTIVHRISIDGLAINYQATGAVPGHVLNQFSMDEYNGYLRIATTNCCSQSSDPTPLAYAPVNQQETNVYVLDKSLHTAGKLEGLSPGEQIYSARFMGDKAYLVTFKRTDPLFVIGLRDPAKPTVLGQLNVTGVSDYLQPYDETHLIGIGQSGTDVVWENAVRFTGLKISLFNVTDPKQPTETSRYLIGGPGTSSPAITDHKAVLFEQILNLLVLPVEVTAQPQNATYWYSYQPIWQGAYVFNITPDKGFVFRSGITQLQSGQLPTWQDNNLFITRTLYIGNVLYTISNNVVEMNSLTDLSELGSVGL